MSCSSHKETQERMFLELANVKKGIGRTILDNADICIDTVMGKPVTGKQPSDMYVFWSVACKWVTKIYYSTLKNREGVG